MARTARALKEKTRHPAPEKLTVTLTVNGRETQLSVAPWTTLLDALRDRLGPTGTEQRRRHRQCGPYAGPVSGPRVTSRPPLAGTQRGAGVTAIRARDHDA